LIHFYKRNVQFNLAAVSETLSFIFEIPEFTN